jgi:hypothetical protein
MCRPGQANTSDKTSIVDGDTLWLNGMNLRLLDFDTPEPSTAICGGAAEVELAHQASSRLRELLNSNDWTLETFGNDRHGRTLATIRIDGVDVGDTAGLWPRPHMLAKCSNSTGSHQRNSVKQTMPLERFHTRYRS